MASELPKKGKWIKASGAMPSEYFGRHICSVCERFALRHPFKDEETLTKYCPNCGSEMR